MKKMGFLLFMSYCLLTFSSCYRMLFNRMGVLEESLSYKKIENENQQIVFIPIHHIGKREFYSSVKKINDSLREAGFVFYYEKVRVRNGIDSLILDTLVRKFRWVTGNDIFAIRAQGGYIDTVNNTVFNKELKILKKEKLVNQPPYGKLGVDTVVAIWPDVYLEDLMQAYEEKFGTILLSECDRTAPFNKKYPCRKNKSKEERAFILEDFRNESIVNCILKDTSRKIALVYGAKHYGGILRLLQQHNSTWKAIQ